MLATPCYSASGLASFGKDSLFQPLIHEVISLVPGLEQAIKENQFDLLPNHSDPLTIHFDQLNGKKVILIHKGSTIELPTSDNGTYTIPRDSSSYAIKDSKSGVVRRINVDDGISEISEPGYFFTTSEEMLPLVIKTYPSDAKIKISKLKGEFRNGMPVKPGMYKLVVQKEGYKRYLRKIVVSDYTFIYHVKLNKL